MTRTRPEEIEARLAAATQGRLRWAIFDPDADPVETFGENLSYGAGDVHAVIALDHPQHVGSEEKPEHCVTVAITGNGPTSERNADFIANAPADLRFLLDQNRALRAALVLIAASGARNTSYAFEHGQCVLIARAALAESEVQG